MAWTENGSATRNSSSGSGTTITHGLTINSGDLVVAFIHTNNTDGGSGPSTVTADSDSGGTWRTDQASIRPGGQTSTMACFSKIATASEPTSYSFSWTPGTGNNVVIIRVDTPDNENGGDLDDNSWQDDQPSSGINVSALTASTASSVGYMGVAMDNRNSANDTVWTFGNSYTSIVFNDIAQYLGTARRAYTSIGSTGTTLVDQDAVNDDYYAIHVLYSENAAAGGDVTFTTNSSGLTIAAQNATAALNVNFTSGTAALATAAFAAAVRLDASFATALALLTLAEQSATVDYGATTEFTTAPSTLTLTEQGATADFSTIVNTLLTSLAFTGHTAGVSVGADTSFQTNLGTLNTSTFSAQTDFNTAFTAALATIGLTGQPITLSFDKDITTNLASLGFTTNAATIALPKEITTKLRSLGIAVYSQGINDEPATVALVSKNRRLITLIGR